MVTNIREVNVGKPGMRAFSFEVAGENDEEVYDNGLRMEKSLSPADYEDFHSWTANLVSSPCTDSKNGDIEHDK